MSAAAEWEVELSGNVHFTSIKVGSCSGAEREVCVHASDKAYVDATRGATAEAAACTERRGWKDRADIYIPVDYDAQFDDAFMVEVMAHELGHAMGLEHVLPETAVMYWESDVTASTGRPAQTWRSG